MERIKLRLRLDYMSSGKNSRSIFGKKNIEQLAEDVRQNKVALMRNIPVQGIFIEDIDMSQEVYSIYDEINSKSVAFAPVIITILADSIEDAISFTMKDEFRTVQILEPPEIKLTALQIEKLFFKVNEELLNYRNCLERKLDNWR